MSMYKIEYTRNIDKAELLLEVDFVSSEFKNTELIKYVITKLKELKQEKIYEGMGFVKINGPISLPLAYVFAHEVQHNVSVVAVNYPQLHCYLITHSSNPNYQIGDAIDGMTNEKILLDLPEQPSQAFTANYFEGVLNINCQLGVVEGNILIKEAAQKIDDLINSQIIKGGELLKINGKSSVAVSYMIAHKLGHLYGNIAVWDPKLCDYVITLRHGGKYAEGELINHVSSPTLYQKKIVICGPANRGKTVLRDGLNRVLSKFISSENYFVVSGCPDGDGAWFNDACLNNLSKAAELKQKYKKSFTMQFAKAKAEQISLINTPLVLFDVGGKTIDDELTPENNIIMQQATHALIVGGNEEEIAIWRQCCHKLNLPIIAEIISKNEPGGDFLTQDSPVFNITIHQLLRGKPSGKGLEELAKFLA